MYPVPQATTSPTYMYHFPPQLGLNLRLSREQCENTNLREYVSSHSCPYHTLLRHPHFLHTAPLCRATLEIIYTPCYPSSPQPFVIPFVLHIATLKPF